VGSGAPLNAPREKNPARSSIVPACLLRFCTFSNNVCRAPDTVGNLTAVPGETFTYTEFTEGYRDFEEVVADGSIEPRAAFEALAYVYLNLGPNLSSAEEANCAYLLQRANQMLFGWVGLLGEK
jgi:hypothetical protein